MLSYSLGFCAPGAFPQLTFFQAFSSGAEHSREAEKSPAGTSIFELPMPRRSCCAQNGLRRPSPGRFSRRRPEPRVSPPPASSHLLSTVSSLGRHLLVTDYIRSFSREEQFDETPVSREDMFQREAILSRDTFRRRLFRGLFRVKSSWMKHCFM